MHHNKKIQDAGFILRNPLHLNSGFVKYMEQKFEYLSSGGIR